MRPRKVKVLKSGSRTKISCTLFLLLHCVAFSGWKTMTGSFRITVMITYLNDCSLYYPTHFQLSVLMTYASPIFRQAFPALCLQNSPSTDPDPRSRWCLLIKQSSSQGLIHHMYQGPNTFYIYNQQDRIKSKTNAPNKVVK